MTGIPFAAAAPVDFSLALIDIVPTVGCIRVK
jgi:hypothetical protein